MSFSFFGCFDFAATKALRAVGGAETFAGLCELVIHRVAWLAAASRSFGYRSRRFAASFPR